MSCNFDGLKKAMQLSVVIELLARNRTLCNSKMNDSIRVKFDLTHLTLGNCAVVVPIFHSIFSISDEIFPLIISLL